MWILSVQKRILSDFTFNECLVNEIYIIWRSKCVANNSSHGSLIGFSIATRDLDEIKWVTILLVDWLFACKQALYILSLAKSVKLNRHAISLKNISNNFEFE